MNIKVKDSKDDKSDKKSLSEREKVRSTLAEMAIVAAAGAGTMAQMLDERHVVNKTADRFAKAPLKPSDKQKLTIMSKSEITSIDDIKDWVKELERVNAEKISQHR